MKDGVLLDDEDIAAKEKDAGEEQSAKEQNDDANV